MKKTQKKELAYPRAFVHKNGTGGWSVAWRHHPDTGNHWDAAMYDAPHYWPHQLPEAHTYATSRVKTIWVLLGRGDQP